MFTNSRFLKPEKNIFFDKSKLIMHDTHQKLRYYLTELLKYVVSDYNYIHTTSLFTIWATRCF